MHCLQISDNKRKNFSFLYGNSMERRANKNPHVRVYRKRQQKNSHVQQSNRKSKKHRTAKLGHIDDNHQPEVLSSLSGPFEKNHHSLSLNRMTTIKTSTPKPRNQQSKNMIFPVMNDKNNGNEVFNNLSSSSLSFMQMQHPSKLKRKTVFKKLAFAIFLILLIVILIVTPIVIVYELSPAAQNTEIDPCKSSRTLTFDDIGPNPFWIGSSGYGGMLPGYGGFIWSWANYVNVSDHIAFATALVSGGYDAYIDNTTPSNKLKITTNNSALFYFCSMVVASVITVQTPFTVWGMYLNTIAYTMNVTINSTTSSTLDFSKWKIAIDTIQMFAYGNIFAFDNLVVSGP